MPGLRVHSRYLLDDLRCGQSSFHCEKLVTGGLLNHKQMGDVGEMIIIRKLRLTVLRITPPEDANRDWPDAQRKNET
jgi:hypothetical protein